MQYIVLATDYDGTIAHDGVVDDDTIAALTRLRASSRRLILVTGRELPDLERVMPRVDLFERVVAENGALLYRPQSREERVLADPPPPRFAERLRELRLSPLSVGRVIVATWHPNEDVVLQAIRELGLELQIVFNKGAVMVLPAGVNKESGLAAALEELEISPLNCVGIGDAENDNAMLEFCGAKVAVANAIDAIKETALLVTRGARGAGVSELIEGLLATDLAELDERSPRQQVALGSLPEGEGELRYSPQRHNVLLAGSSGGGKSTLTVGLLERLHAAGFQFCVIDPEGDYEELDIAVALGTQDQAPTPERVSDLLRKAATNAVVNLLGVKPEDRPGLFRDLLAEITKLRARTGRPHVIVVDEAHHMLPDCADPSSEIPEDATGYLFVSVRPSALTQRIVERVDRVIAVGEEPGLVLAEFARIAGMPEPTFEGSLERGEMATLSRDDPQPRRLRVMPASGMHRRHVRKYAQGMLGEDKSFYFRGPDGRLNLRAQNLMMFLQLADGVDDATWDYHRRRGDYSQWIADSIKDDDLAREVGDVERGELDFASAKAAIREAIERRYTLPA